MKTTRKFATSPDILVAKGKHSVPNATVLVAISSPVTSPMRLSSNRSKERSKMSAHYINQPTVTLPLNP